MTLCLRPDSPAGRSSQELRAFARRRLGKAQGAGGPTRWPRPSQAAARGWNGPTHWQRKGKQKERDQAWEWYVPLLEMVGRQTSLLLQGWKNLRCQDAGSGSPGRRGELRSGRGSPSSQSNYHTSYGVRTEAGEMPRLHLSAGMAGGGL